MTVAVQPPKRHLALALKTFLPKKADNLNRTAETTHVAQLHAKSRPAFLASSSLS